MALLPLRDRVLLQIAPPLRTSAFARTSLVTVRVAIDFLFPSHLLRLPLVVGNGHLALWLWRPCALFLFFLCSVAEHESPFLGGSVAFAAGSSEANGSW